MNSWQLLNQYLFQWGRALGAMFRLRTWAPWGVLLLVQGALLSLLYFAVRPPLSGMLRSTPTWILPPGFFDYPTHLLLLPAVLYNRLLPVAGLLVESLLQAAATWIFIRHARGQSLPGLCAAVSEVRASYAQLVLFWLLNHALLIGSGALFDLAVGDLWSGYSRRRFALDVAQFLLTATVNSVLAYSTAVIVLERTSPRATLRHTLRALLRHPLATWTTVLAGTLLTVPFSLALGSASEWIRDFHPEVVILILSGSLLASVIASYLVVAVLTSWYLVYRRPN